MNQTKNKEGNSACWYVHQAKTLRLKAGLSMNKLAQLAGVGRDSVSKVEKFKPVTDLVAEKIFSALNISNGGELSRERYIRSHPEK